MSLRNGWKFDHKASEVQPFAEAKRDHHRERFEHWSAELKEARAALETRRAYDQQHREEVVSGELSYSTRVVQQSAEEVRVNEADRKVDFHQRAFEEYDRFVRVFATHGQQTLQLDPEDLQHFGM